MPDSKSNLGICDRLNNSPKDAHVLVMRIFMDVTKDLKGRLSWIIQMGPI